MSSSAFEHKLRRGPYIVRMWSRGPEPMFRTIRECRAYAESYGTTADQCTIVDSTGRVVALHVRDTSTKVSPAGAIPPGFFASESTWPLNQTTDCRHVVGLYGLTDVGYRS